MGSAKVSRSPQARRLRSAAWATRHRRCSAQPPRGGRTSSSTISGGTAHQPDRQVSSRLRAASKESSSRAPLRCIDGANGVWLIHVRDGPARPESWLGLVTSDSMATRTGAKSRACSNRCPATCRIAAAAATSSAPNPSGAQAARTSMRWSPSSSSESSGHAGDRGGGCRRGSCRTASSKMRSPARSGFGRPRAGRLPSPRRPSERGARDRRWRIGSPSAAG